MYSSICRSVWMIKDTQKRKFKFFFNENAFQGILRNFAFLTITPVSLLKLVLCRFSLMHFVCKKLWGKEKDISFIIFPTRMCYSPAKAKLWWMLVSIIVNLISSHRKENWGQNVNLDIQTKTLTERVLIMKTLQGSFDIFFVTVDIC